MRGSAGRGLMNRTLASRLDRLNSSYSRQVFPGQAGPPAQSAGRRHCQLARRSHMLAGRRRSLAGSVCVTVVAMVALAGAHHSPVMFDRTVTKTLVGTVVEFAWTNPHASIQLDVPNEKGGAD